MKKCLCCFLTVSCPTYKRHFSKFWCFGFSTIKKKTRENSTVLRCPKKKATKITFIPLQSLPDLAWVQNEDSPSLKMSICDSKHRAMASRGREMSLKKFELTASVQSFFCKVTYQWRCSDVALGFSSNVTCPKSPSAGMDTRWVLPSSVV